MLGGTQVRNECILLNMHLELGLHPCAWGSMIIHDDAFKENMKY